MAPLQGVGGVRKTLGRERELDREGIRRLP
jgi:hypothetical protein